MNENPCVDNILVSSPIRENVENFVLYKYLHLNYNDVVVLKKKNIYSEGGGTGEKRRGGLGEKIDFSAKQHNVAASQPQTCAATRRHRSAGQMNKYYLFIFFVLLYEYIIIIL